MSVTGVLSAMEMWGWEVFFSKQSIGWFRHAYEKCQYAEYLVLNKELLIVVFNGGWRSLRTRRSTRRRILQSYHESINYTPENCTIDEMNHDNHQNRCCRDAWRRVCSSLLCCVLPINPASLSIVHPILGNLNQNCIIRAFSSIKNRWPYCWHKWLFLRMSQPT